MSSVYRYQVEILDRNYSSYRFVGLDDLSRDNNNKCNNKICPYKARLFHGDIIEIPNAGDEDKFYMIPSPLRSTKNIPGLLQLSTGKTFGREGKKQLVKCIPNDRHLPIFLVPYEDKHPGFYKTKVDKYVTFSIEEWTQTEKHPRGMIRSMIGSVDDYGNFCDYQMICRGLNDSIRPISLKGQNLLKQIGPVSKSDENIALFIESICTKHNIVFPSCSSSSMTPCAKTRIYTIDPEGCVDNDDAFSIEPAGIPGHSLLTIYIADVALMMDKMDLWDEFADRVSTVYLPSDQKKQHDEDGGKRPMLPPFLSDNVFSLRPGKPRMAIAYEYIVNEETGEILSQSELGWAYISTKCISVDRQFSYEERELLENADYLAALKLVQRMNMRYGESRFVVPVSPTEQLDSHEFVAYLMILVNHDSAERIIYNCFESDGIMGILRSGYHAVIPATATSTATSTSTLSDPLYRKFPDGVARFINAYENGGSKSQYVVATSESTTDATYCHITSPIRRLVDLLNQVATHPLADELSEKSHLFLKGWCARINYINEKMRDIKRIQNDCQTYYTFLERPRDFGNIDSMQHHTNKLYKAYVMGEDKDMTDSKFVSCYLVYIPDLKLMTTLKIIIREVVVNSIVDEPVKRELRKFDIIMVSIYAFFDEAHMTRKIRTRFESFVENPYDDSLLSYVNDKLQETSIH